MRKGKLGRWNRVLIDATWDDTWDARQEWGAESPAFRPSSEKELRPVREKLERYGFSN